MSLSDFSPRKIVDVKKGYLLGRYGAIPKVVDMLENLWQE